MRIALLSTSAVSVPPQAYGGTELVIAELAKNFTRLGHDVTVFATGDSRPCARLQSCFPRAVWPPDPDAELRHTAFAWRQIASQEPPFDVVHAHQSQALAFGVVAPVPLVLTIHHDRQEPMIEYYLDHPGVRYVAISRRQADLAPELAVRSVVHHGLDPSLYAEGNGGEYVACVGRLTAEKAPHLAISAARAARVPLRIGGVPHDDADRCYFAREVRPRFGEDVVWLGELSHGLKVQLLRHARALLVPLASEEPFGLGMIEAMLVGTPVIAFARGGAPEIVEDGVTGFVVRSAEEMARRIRDAHRIDRRRCRARAVERWSSMRMAREYLRVYEEAIREHREARERARFRDGATELEEGRA